MIGYTVYDSTKREVDSLGVDVTLIPRTLQPQEEFEWRESFRWPLIERQNDTYVVPQVASGFYTIEVIFWPPKAVAEVVVEIK